MSKITKAAVIGAGVMGSGIAAHLANAGIEVVMLDTEAAIAAASVVRQVKVGGFMDAAFSTRVSPGSIMNDLDLINDADWIVEAVAERLDVKQALYRQIEAVRKANSIVSSNTSTIPLATLVQGLPDSFKRDFLISHFFNPPRSMRLLELVSGPKTQSDVVGRIRDFADRKLGKSVVTCKDTPGFIANRIGSYWMAVAINEAIRFHLDIDVADAVISKPFGIPKTGVFGLFDLVGIDLMVTVLRSLQGALPRHDAIHDYEAEPPLIARLIAENRLGRKSGAGFVRITADRRSRDVTDLATGDYRPEKAIHCDCLDDANNDPRAIIEHASLAGQYAAITMENTLSYAAAQVPEIADCGDAVDEAMRTGYGWSKGPFELIDQLGATWLTERLRARRISIPSYLDKAAGRGGFYGVADGLRHCLLPNGTTQPVGQDEGIIKLAALRLHSAPVETSNYTNLWDLRDGIACLELRTKMNTINSGVFDSINAALERTKREFQGLIIGSDAPFFSVGADLRVLLETAERNGAAALGTFIDQGHLTFNAIKFAGFPVVGAASGLALGGGCEMLLHCSAIQAHAELNMGLVETSVGLIPGWGGCKEMLLRFSSEVAGARGPVAPALAAFGLIAPARRSLNAFEARTLGILRPADRITMNRDRLLADAKKRALELTHGYQPPAPASITLPGPAGAAALRNILDTEDWAGRLRPHDRVVGEALVGVLTGGFWDDPTRPVTEDVVAKLERQTFVELLASSATIDRMRHMLTIGKPLRN